LRPSAVEETTETALSAPSAVEETTETALSAPSAVEETTETALSAPSAGRKPRKRLFPHRPPGGNHGNGSFRTVRRAETTETALSEPSAAACAPHRLQIYAKTVNFHAKWAEKAALP